MIPRAEADRLKKAVSLAGLLKEQKKVAREDRFQTWHKGGRQKWEETKNGLQGRCDTAVMGLGAAGAQEAEGHKVKGVLY